MYIQVAQTVGDDAQVVVAKSGNTVAVILIELSDLLTGHLVVEDVIRFV